MKTLSLLLLALVTPPLAYAKDGGGVGGHGGTTTEQEEIDAYQVMVERELKTDLAYYLPRMRERHLFAQDERAPLAFLQDPALLADVEASPYVVGDCRENRKWVACAGYGELGGTVVFDVKRLARLYRGQTPTPAERMRRLRAIALHEEYHHLRGKKDFSRRERKAHESEAAFIGGFVLRDVREEWYIEPLNLVQAKEEQQRYLDRRTYDLMPVHFNNPALCERAIHVLSQIDAWVALKIGAPEATCVPDTAGEGGAVLRSRLTIREDDGQVVRKGRSFKFSVIYDRELEPSNHDDFVEWVLEQLSSRELALSCLDSCYWSVEPNDKGATSRKLNGAITFLK